MWHPPDSEPLSQQEMERVHALQIWLAAVDKWGVPVTAEQFATINLYAACPNCGRGMFRWLPICRLCYRRQCRQQLTESAA